MTALSNRRLAGAGSIVRTLLRANVRFLELRTRPLSRRAASDWANRASEKSANGRLLLLDLSQSEDVLPPSPGRHEVGVCQPGEPLPRLRVGRAGRPPCSRQLAGHGGPAALRWALGPAAGRDGGAEGRPAGRPAGLRGRGPHPRGRREGGGAAEAVPVPPEDQVGGHDAGALRGLPAERRLHVPLHVSLPGRWASSVDRPGIHVHGHTCVRVRVWCKRAKHPTEELWSHLSAKSQTTCLPGRHCCL